MLLNILLLLAQITVPTVPGVLSAPDPAQMETAPDLGYRAVEAGLKMPADMKMGAPSSVVFDAHGHMLVFNRGERRILRFDRTGKLLKSWGGNGTAPGQFDQPHSLYVDRQNQVYVADRNNRRVQIFDVDGRFIKSWAFKGLPCGFLMGPDQQLY